MIFTVCISSTYIRLEIKSMLIFLLKVEEDSSAHFNPR